MSASAQDSLPEIRNHSLTEASATDGGRRHLHTFSAPGFSPAVSLLSRHQAGALTSSSRSVHHTAPLQARSSSPVSVRSPSPGKRTPEFVRLSRGELEHREQTIASLRKENVELQSKVRELEKAEEGFKQLKLACDRISQSLSCNTEGIAPESVREVLCCRVAKLSQDHDQSVKEANGYRSDLEASRAELAAANIKVSSITSQLEGLKSSLAAKDAQIHQLKVENEGTQQSLARTSAMLQSLRQQLEAVEGEKRSNQHTQSHFQGEIGRLKSRLMDKESELKAVEDHLSFAKEEHETLQERASMADAAYEELCIQLADSLQMDPSESCDYEKIVNKVTSLVQECDRLRMRLETVSKSSEAAELDLKANRETILRLVAEVKKSEQVEASATALQKKISDLENHLKFVENEKMLLTNQLQLTKSTVSSLECELNAKDSRMAKLSESVEVQRVSKEQGELSLRQHEEFYSSLASVLNCSDCSPTTIRKTARKLLEHIAHLEQEISSKSSQLTKLQYRLQKYEMELEQKEETIDGERSKVKELQGQSAVVDVLQFKLQQESDKHKAFCRRLSKALDLDSVSSGILTGDFADDALVVKAEQLAKMETQALVDRQSAFYSLQRKHKSCRQQLETKELQLTLLHKKVATVDQRLGEMTLKESEWDSTIDKGKKTAKQLERLQSKLSQQKELIAQLRQDNDNLVLTKSLCEQLENQVKQLSSEVEHLRESRIQLSQQLADARHRVQAAQSKDKDRAQRLDEELEAVREQLKAAQDRNKQLLTFQGAVQRVLATCSHGNQTPRTDPSGPTEELHDWEIISSLERVAVENQRLQDNARNLQASLRQLEHGFKSGYRDTLSLLNIDPS